MVHEKTKLKQIASFQGFNLLELIITVSIVTILALMAMPNYKAYRLKAIGAIAKNHLASLLQFEKVFFNEFNSYSSRLDQIGFQVDGALPFNIGFGSDFPVNAPGAPIGSPTCNFTCEFDSATCAKTVCASTANWTCSLSASSALDGNVMSSISATAFQAEAHGHLANGVCGEGARTDIHSYAIDQNGKFYFTPNGL